MVRVRARVVYLVCVPRALVVVRVGDESGDDAEDGHGVDLQVRAARCEVRLRQCDERVVLLVHVQVLQQAVGEEVVECAHAAVELRQVGGGEEGSALVHDEERAGHASAVCGDVDGAVRVVDVHGHEGGQLPHAAQRSQLVREAPRVAVHAQQLAVDEHEVAMTLVPALAGQQL